MKIFIVPVIGIACAAANAQEALPNTVPPAVMVHETASPQAPVQLAKLVAGTGVIVTLSEDLSTVSTKLGDSFGVTVLHDVVQDGTVVIPKGTSGRGEVTFVTKKGSFGKPGILGISLRHLDLNGQRVLLDGRYREEGGNNNGAAAATMFTVGVAAILVKGKSSSIPEGRELKARTGEDIHFAIEAAPSSNEAQGPQAAGNPAYPSPITAEPTADPS